MNVSEALVLILEKEGITDAFGIPGAGINGVYKYLEKSNKIQHYTVRHEESAVHAASGYYRASGRMAVALCTSGPGATNFVTGIYTSNIDSIPLIAITGQGNRASMGKDAFQCVDIVKICDPIAKATFCITDEHKAVEIFRNAFKIAKEGKPGVVLLDIPLDVQLSEITFDINSYVPAELTAPNPVNGDQITQTIAMLTAAKNPLILIGGGVVLADACDEVMTLARTMNIPVVTTYMAKGAVKENDPLFGGTPGIQVGQPIGNKVFLDSDVVLGIGCRFTDRHTGNVAIYKGDRKFIHINIQASEIGKIIPADIGIVADAKEATVALLKEAQKTDARSISTRVTEIPSLKKALIRKTDYDCTPIMPQRVFQEINHVFGDNTMYTTGCGITQIWSGQLQEVNKPKKYLPSGGSGTLGFDIPAAFGAMIGNKKQKAVAVMGDFGFTFHVQELAVAAKHNVPLIVVIVNNAYLGLIRQNQKYAFGYELGVEMKENHTMMDYVKVAEGFACAGERVFDPKEIKPAFERALKANKPYVIDVIVDENADCSMGPALNAIKEFV